MRGTGSSAFDMKKHEHLLMVADSERDAEPQRCVGNVESHDPSASPSIAAVVQSHEPGRRGNNDPTDSHSAAEAAAFETGPADGVFVLFSGFRLLDVISVISSTILPASDI